MRQVKSPSFEFYEPDQIAQAAVIEQLISLTRNSPIKAGGEAWVCAWVPDNSYFAWSSGHHMLHLVAWNKHKQKCHEPSGTGELEDRPSHSINCGETIWSVAFGSGLSGQASSRFYRHCRFDQSLVVATGLANGRIHLWNCTTGALMIDLLDHRDTVRSLDFTKDGSLQLLSASRDGCLKLWDLHNEGNLYKTYKIQSSMFYSSKFAPNGNYIAAVGSCKMVYLWSDTRLDSEPCRLAGHCNEVVSCDFSPDSALLITAAYDTKVIVWATHSQQKLWTFGHMHPSPRLIFAGGAKDHYVRDFSFCRDGVTFASVCDDGYVRFWSLGDVCDPVIVACVGEPLSCQFSPEGSVLAVGLRNGDVTFLRRSTPIPSLLQLSRQAINKSTCHLTTSRLPIPRVLVDFVRYLDFPELVTN